MRTHQARQPSVASAFVHKTLAVTIALAALCAPTGSYAAGQPERLRHFTIEDSIELSYFANPILWTMNQEPATEPIVSPDQDHFLVVTQRGILATNEIESSIWVLDRQAVDDFASKRTAQRPEPKRIATWHATANTPIISDVRWLRDSRRVAFLARMKNGQSQLFTADSLTGDVTQITHASQSVSAYDIQGRTVAFTTIDEPQEISGKESDLIDVTGKNIFNLLWGHQATRDRDESLLLTRPNTLHIMKDGHELNAAFVFEGKPLKLFFPVLSISPDEELLVTVAPVSKIPVEWNQYEPRFGYEDLKLDPANKWALTADNAWKPSQFVTVNFQTAAVTPLIESPAGRSLFHNFAPTEAIWSPDSRRILLSDTFLPLNNPNHKYGQDKETKKHAPAAAVVDFQRGTIAVISYFPQPARGTSAVRHISDIVWNAAKDRVDFRYASTPDNVPLPYHESYAWNGARWEKSESSHTGSEPLRVDQDLNQSPVLVVGSSVIWDPNPQLANVALGDASPYRWRDKEGRSRNGILVLPPDYEPGHRYPLVIQTHGFERNKFFADGIYTTGSGGRAFCGRGIILLQTEQYSRSSDPRQDADIQIEAFRSAIEQLSADGFVDSKRVGVIGFSFTVYHVLYGITHYPNLFAAASITDGNDLSYWLYLMWTDIPFAQQLAEAANGNVKPFGRAGLSKWQESAPGFALDRVQTPLLISCLEEGTLVGTWDIYGGLRTLGKPVDLLWLKNEDAPHVLVQPHHRLLSQASAVDWFDFWLNGHEDPVPGKADQYARWRMLREAKENATQKSRTAGDTRLLNGPSH
jgi:hypothetical protein